MRKSFPCQIISAWALGSTLLAQDLKFTPGSGKLNVEWTVPAPTLIPRATTRSTHQLLMSEDLRTWRPLGGPIPGDLPGLRKVESLPNPPAALFFRLESQNRPLYLAQEGDDGFGFQRVLDERLVVRRDLAPELLPQAFPTGQRLERVSYDPTQAKFWADFAADPAVYNAQLPPNNLDRRETDFRLNAREGELFRKNGFVVSGRLGSYSFADVFYRVWMDDLPVYVSSDAILHAWHKTFVRMLEEVEEFALRSKLEQILTSMHSRLVETRDSRAAAALRESFDDVDVMLNVARRLLNTVDVKAPANLACVFPQNQKLADEFFAEALKAERAIEYGAREIFGEKLRWIDFTQCLPRGHYPNSPTLSAYFRAMQWLGQVDFRLGGGSPITKGNIRQLGGSVVMSLLLKESGALPRWTEMDGLLKALVGEVDSLTPPQLLSVLAADKLDGLDAWTSADLLTSLQTRVLEGKLGVQNMASQLVWAPMGEQRIVFPRSFTLIGQRFVVDGWTIGQTVFDRIWTTDEQGKPVRVRRRLTSALDVAFAALGNNTPAKLLAERMTRTNGQRFRDGLPYAFHLAAVRDTVDALPANAWTSTTYHRWLWALRTLSRPIGNGAPTVPEVFRTEAWDASTMNTQLASWTQLRHNTILYAKATYTPPTICSYPDGYVEPQPDFWAAMKDLAEHFRAALNASPMKGQVEAQRTAFDPLIGIERAVPIQVNLAVLQAGWNAHLANFGKTMDTLQGIAEAHLACRSLNSDQIKFLEGLIQRFSGDSGVRVARNYAGWYPRLFYISVFPQPAEQGRTVPPHPSDEFDAIVTDVHSDAPDQLTGDPGAIIHQAVGHVPLMMLTIQHADGERVTYAGPVLSHYEFLKPWGTRLTDAQWKSDLLNGLVPDPPEWTASFLVPGRGSFTPVAPGRFDPWQLIP